LTKLFKKKPYKYVRKSENVLYLEISMKDLGLKLKLPIGDKIKNKVRIPDWISSNKIYLAKCLRGLFDTDGCCYLVKRKYKIVNFRSHNLKLINDIEEGLISLGFSAYVRVGKNVEIGKQLEVLRFFSIIKPRNNSKLKHFRAR